MSRDVHLGRHTASMPGDYVVFLSAMRLSRPWKPHKWLPVFISMFRMIHWLERKPDSGLLQRHLTWISGPAVLLYWRSFDDLERFARGPDAPHLRTWQRFNGAVRASGDVGIWHETHQVRADKSETFYGNMHKVGLAAAGNLTRVGSTALTAAQRTGHRELDQPPVAPHQTGTTTGR